MDADRRTTGTSARRVIAVAAISTFCRMASAQPREGDSAADAAARATQYYQQGVDASKQGRFQKAYDAFLAAWKLRRHYQVAANLGRTEARIGKHRDAAEHLAYFLREAKDIAPDERQLAATLLDEAKTKIGTLTIESHPSGAAISIDGESVGTVPLGEEVYVEAGAHVVEATREGLLAARRQIEIKRGTSQHLMLTLSPAPPAGAVASHAPSVGRNAAGRTT